MNYDPNQNNNEFKTLGVSIEKFSIFYGLFLIFWGIIISLISSSNSFTSYIPTILGFPVLIFAYLSIKFVSKKKIFMHIVVFLGLIIFLGGLDLIRSILIGVAFMNYWADISKLMMLITGLFFTYKCVRSFIHTSRMKRLKD